MHLHTHQPALHCTVPTAPPFSGYHCSVKHVKSLTQLSRQPRKALFLDRLAGSPSTWRRCSKVTPTAAVKTEEPATASEVPESREQSISQAAIALQGQLPKEKKGKARSTKSGSLKKLAIDIPVADQSPQAAVELVRDLLACLSRSEADAFTIIFGDSAAAEIASGPNGLVGNTSMSMSQILDGKLAGPLLICGVQDQQVTNVQEMLFSWHGRLATLINAEWDEEQSDADLASFVKSWEYIYCFGPLEIQGFFSKREGCIFKYTKRGSPSSSKWSILTREDGKTWKVVGRQQRRPSAGEMELAFYNAAASNSPITKGVKFVKDIADKGFKKK